MSNSLIKAYRVNINQDDDAARVIDSNQAISDRLQLLNEIMNSSYSEDEYEGEFVEGLNAEMVDALFEDGGDDTAVEPKVAEPYFDQAEIDNLIAQANEQAEAIINEANEQANQIINNANEQAQAIKENAFEQGYQEGSAKGYEDSMAKTQALEDEYNDKIRQNEIILEDTISQLEPRFVSLISDIYTHFFKCDLADKSEIVLHLIKDAIRNIDGGRNFFVHVSREDYESVVARKEELMAGLASTCLVEVVEDISLESGASFIETESGIFDCALDTELDLLKKELDLLAYVPNE